MFGDYDVDGITATCLLTEFLRERGGDVVSYIPARLEEGYGLNPTAIEALSAQGVRLIVTVDCGITALDEALCAAKKVLIWSSPTITSARRSCRSARRSLIRTAPTSRTARSAGWLAWAWRSSSPPRISGDQTSLLGAVLRTFCASARWRM